MTRIKGLVLVCVSITFSAAGVIHATPPPAILKVDPNPVLVGTLFEVVYSLQNLSASDHQFQVQMTAEGPIRTNAVTVPANGTLVSTFSAVALQPGSHTLELRATEAIGTILVPHGPTGVQEITQWGNPVTASGSYIAYDGVHPPLRPRVSRIGPRDPGTTSPAGNSNSGVIGHLAGSLQSLYAVSKHAGVWKSSGGSFWRQLVSAPKHAAVIAVDPDDVRHVIVGERADDTANSVAGEAGVWESRDGGETWEQIYDPGLDPNLSGGTGIRGVAFGPHSRTILIATSRGVGVRAAIPDLSEVSRGFEFPDSARGAIRELAVSQNVVWALSGAGGGTVLSWRMDWPGWRDLNLNQPSTWVPWTSTVVPKTVSVWTDDLANPPVDNVPTAGFVGLSSFDDRVFFAFNPSVGPNHPQASLDPGCKAPATKPVCDIFQNRMAILSFDPISSSGVLWRGQLTKDNDGRGLGGRVFTFASTLRCPSLPATIGSGRRLYLVSAQSVQEARSMSANGLFDWSSPVGTSRGMHSDYWDVYLDGGTCPPSDFAAWLATDGGVFRGRIDTSGGTGTAPNPQFVGTLDGLDWVPASLGLETQNAHAIALAKKPTDVLPRILYATGDNDGWWGIPSGPWNGGGTAGDANGALTDGVTPWGIAFRGYSGGGTCGGGNCAYATAFNNGIERSFNIGGRVVPFASSTVFTFIQKLATEIQNPGAVEAVMLVQLPLMDATGAPIAGVVGSDNSTTRMAIIRTADYASHAGDFPSGWSIERDNLPPETERFWVSGGSLNTHYYLFTPSASSCLSGLMGEARGKAVLGQWTCLHRNLEFADDEAAKELRDPSFVMAPSGPAFVNPFEPNVIVVTSLGSSPTIEVTLDGGLNFCPLPGLAGLVTHSGQLPLSGDDGQGRFNPDSRFSEVGSKYHGGVMSRIANVGFDRANPFRAIVVTPSAGVYYGDLSLTAIDRLSGIKCKEPTWLALQGTSENWGYPSTGVLLDGTAYLGTEGNGIFQINSPSAGLQATYFDLAQTFAPGSAIATLKTSRAIVPWTRYTLRVIADIDNASRRQLHPDEPQTLRRTDTTNGRTDEKGTIAMPNDPVVQDMFGLGIPLACELDSMGDGQHAPAHLRFKCGP